MTFPILQQPHKVLRRKAEEVPVDEIPSPKIQKILKDMALALGEQDDGVAIATPQIGVPLKIFVVSGKIFSKEFVRGKGVPEGTKDIPKDLVFINPKIIKLSKKKEYLLEGCLSCRWLYGEVLRRANATVEAYDQHGKKFRRGAGGFLAQIFQHEIDHLNGILFIDKARNLQELPPESVNKAGKQVK